MKAYSKILIQEFLQEQEHSHVHCVLFTKLLLSTVNGPQYLVLDSNQ